jgi:hypothetical protein
MRREENDPPIRRLDIVEYVRLLISRRPLQRALPYRIKAEDQRWTLRDLRTGEFFAPQWPPPGPMAGRERA